jgi:ATP-dependent helicase/nuclease subunit B
MTRTKERSAMKSKGSQTLYLGRKRPLLHSTVDFIERNWPVDRSRGELVWNLSNLLIVLPSARSGRRLFALLTERTKTIGNGCTLVRPRIITVGELAGNLCKPNLPIASEIEQTLAWARVLVETPDDQLSALLSTLPPREPLTPWIELASTLRGLHEDLAAGEIDFAAVEREVNGEAEKKRWQLLNALHGRYLTRLASAGRVDPYVAGATAIREKKCACNYDILLVGTSDLSRSVASMLRSLLDSKRDCGSITALVAADDAERDHFDAFGSIIATQWLKRHLPLRDEQIIAAQDVADQAGTAAGFIEELAGDLKADQITLGVTDESLVGPIEFELRTRGIKSRRELGWTIAQTPVGRLLELLALHLSQGTWRSLAALVRHADIYDFIERHQDGSRYLFAQDDWLTSLDNLIANHYPTLCDAELPEQARQKHQPAVDVRDLVQRSLRDLRGSARTLSDWAGRVSAWLTVVYEPETLESQHAYRSQQAISTASNFLHAIQEMESSLDVKISASSAIEMLMSRLTELRVLDPAGDEKVTISGWLDLALDDSPAMVITSLNHPYVPEAITADPFLPGSLRTRLQLNDNERRMARDIHALDVILSCRDKVRLIVGARSLDGSPTPPSRLLAACEPIDAAKRLVSLLEPKRAAQPIKFKHDATKRWSGNLEKSDLPIPKLSIDKPVTIMSVTAFKDYLDCPYRFYLRHVLRLRPLDDASGELQPNQFGDLIHNTLQWFGESDLKDSTNPQSIEGALHDTLDRYARDFFGTSPNATVKLQIQQARRRLSSVAIVQSERRMAGWTIHKVEAPFGEDEKASIEVDRKPMSLRGRIDRIDRHDDGRWAIIDYKTHGHPPRKKHLYYEHDVIHWTDLQLPLYQKLIRFVIGESVKTEQVSLSYFNIGDNQQQTKINDADFTPEEFASANNEIARIVQGIRRGDFAPADDVTFDDYSMILQTGAIATLFDRLIAGDVDNPVLAEGAEA